MDNTFKVSYIDIANLTVAVRLAVRATFKVLNAVIPHIMGN